MPDRWANHVPRPHYAFVHCGRGAARRARIARGETRVPGEFFRVACKRGVLLPSYALSAMLDLPANATRARLLDAMKDIIVGKSAYVGRFRQ
jgi:hypothetical protein